MWDMKHVIKIETLQGTSWNPENSHGTVCPESSFQQREIGTELGKMVSVCKQHFLCHVNREGNVIFRPNIWRLSRINIFLAVLGKGKNILQKGNDWS